jgi:hypothetical protein
MVLILAYKSFERDHNGITIKKTNIREFRWELDDGYAPRIAYSKLPLIEFF